jgi:tetratricopeptide (TPR) repeat protein
LWREVGDQHWALGERGEAEQAWLRHLSVPVPEPLVHEAAVALQRKDNVSAEEILRLQLKHYPADVVALRVLAELLSSTDRYDEAEQILRLCLERVPSFALARYGLAMVLFHNHKLPPALEQVERLLEGEPQRFEYLDLKADTLGRLGEFEEAAACLETIVALYPNQGGAWSNYGDTLRTLGRRADCEAAYRRAIALNASAGFAYWGLANLKTFKFEPSDVASMGERVQRLSGEDRVCLLFALGKALEDQGKYEEAFSTYSQANSERRARLPHDRSEPAETTRRARSVFTRAFFAEREGMGCEAPDAIFVVGMPRSGSTLVEQILSSHSSVEGTMELIELMAIAKRLGKDRRYPELLRDIGAEELARLGREYLDRARPFRKTSAVRFIDKLPNNFAQAGLIHLILPNARIIDVRRHPLACCVSIFKQHWATGQTFAYDLQDIGAFYRSYVELMAHFDAVLPGRVHRVVYEDLVADPQAATRRLLEACGLPFEENCLRFYENRRAVRTPSSEQVRQPIYSAGLDNWRPFEPWLEPLKSALGPVLEAYPAAPAPLPL